MSEQAEREIEIVAGIIGGITQKKADTWTVAVTPEGSQYAKNLWTKDVELVESLSTKIGQAGAFVCSASYWNLEGKQVRSLWIQGESDGTENVPGSVATPAAAPQGKPPEPGGIRSGAGEGMSKEEWARKDSAIHKMACIKVASDALKHTIPSSPTQDDLKHFSSNVMWLVAGWHRVVLAERDDPTGESVPF